MTTKREPDGVSTDTDSEELTAWDARRKRLYKEAFREALIEFGFDPAEPLEIQQDQAWLRRRRKLEESMTAKVVGAILTLLVPGAVAGAVASYFQR